MMNKFVVYDHIIRLYDTMCIYVERINQKCLSYRSFLKANLQYQPTVDCEMGGYKLEILLGIEMVEVWRTI